MENLNAWPICGEGHEKHPQMDHSIDGGITHVYFRNIEDRLIEHISEYEYVFGCVAWLTNVRILNALSSLKACSIIMQKEDWLRPDHHGPAKEELRRLFAAIHPGERNSFTESLYRMSCGSDPDIGMRCAGVHAGRTHIPPRMHNKFAVFCILDGDSIKAQAVWTGSFNWTNNASRSFENAVFIQDIGIAAAFLREYQQIAALSEPLDWAHEYVDPEWRVGT